MRRHTRTKTPFGEVFWIDTDDPYEVTIVQARYGGSYEGAPWLAFPCAALKIPPEYDASDIECMAFWSEHATSPIGKGDHPTEALQDLVEKLNALPKAHHRRS